MDPITYRSIAGRVVWSQVIWTAGYSLTSGPILSFFGQDLGAKGLITALLLIVPETAGVLGLFTRSAIRHLRSRKRVWIVFSLLARGLSLGIPLAAFPATHPHGLDPLWLMAGSLAVSQAAQAISYVAYLGWLADAVPSQRWGRFFAARSIGELSVLLIVPVAGGYLRDWWKIYGVPQMLTWAYVVAFAIGALLLLASMIPLIAVPEKRSQETQLKGGDLKRLRATLRNPSLRFLLIHSWWLAISNGVTQAAFLRYLYGPLRLELGSTYVLNDCRLVVGIPVSWLAGVIADRRGNKWLMVASVLVAGSSLWFWLLAHPGDWRWLFAAYACWGAFPAVNITGRNLVFKLSPAGDNAMALALFGQVSGLLAGLSGLCGGLWLDKLTAAGTSLDLGFGRWESFQIIFAASLLGRLTAAIWLLPIHEPREPAETLADFRGDRRAP